MTGPEIVSWEIYQGSRFSADINLTDPVTGLPVDMTGLGVRSQARKTGVALPQIITVTVITGGIHVELGATESATMAKGTWKFDIEVYNLVDANDVAKPVAGTIIIKEEQTR
jgi:hypothetical protein